MPVIDNGVEETEIVGVIDAGVTERPTAAGNITTGVTIETAAGAGATISITPTQPSSSVGIT